MQWKCTKKYKKIKEMKETGIFFKDHVDKPLMCTSSANKISLTVAFIS